MQNSQIYGPGYNQALMPPMSLNEWERNGENDAGRWARYRRLLDFYDGLQWSERPAPGDRRYVVNYSRLFIQKMASYLLGKGYRTKVIPNKPGKAAASRARFVEERLAEITADNALDLLDYDTAVDCAVLGDAAWKITLQPLNAADHFGHLQIRPVGRPSRASRVVVRPVDMLGLSARWRGDDMRSLLSVCQQYVMSLDEAQEIFGRGITKYRLKNTAPEKPLILREVWTNDHYSLTVEGNQEPFIAHANPYGFIPYVIFPNIRRPRQLWGDSDLLDLMPLQSELNVRMSAIGQLLHYSGNPVLVLENVEQAEQNMRVGPGAVWTLPENSRAYLLELLKEGHLTAHTEYVNLLYQTLHDLSEMPRAAFGRDLGGSTPSSGTALEILLHPLVQKVNRKRAIWNEALYKRNLMIQRLAEVGQAHRTRTIWQDPLPRDRQALVANEVALVNSAIHSRKAAANALGDEQPELTVGEAFNEMRQLAQFGLAKTKSRASGLELQAIVDAGA